MKRWLPFPALSLALLATWLLLNQTLDAGHVLVGTALALGGGHVLAGLQPPKQGVRRRGRALAILFALVLIDIVRSNIAVARIVVRPGTSGRTSGFVSLPLELRHPGGLAALACIITATPGTSWARYDAGRSILTIHVLDLLDEEAWVSDFKQRYERRLMEIFQ
jgi:multicomponent K+:H+ antiporter subunit E